MAVTLTSVQEMLDKGNAFSTIKVYLATFFACHIGLEGKTVGQRHLVGCFMKGVRHRLPSSRQLACSWDLPIVLDLSSFSFRTT